MQQEGAIFIGVRFDEGNQVGIPINRCFCFERQSFRREAFKALNMIASLGGCRYYCHT